MTKLESIFWAGTINNQKLDEFYHAVIGSFEKFIAIVMSRFDIAQKESVCTKTLFDF
ncbi:hypothetical protein W03_19380 [Nitrosomonas sp. PY1]|nr:hypothetical protein W03_19380 [Nitrosomonas sp. PY1]